MRRCGAPPRRSVKRRSPSAVETVRIVQRSDDALIAEMELAPGHKLPPAHRHPAQDEHFEVLEGALRVVLEGEEHVVRAGDSIDVPRGTAHTMGAGGEAPVRTRWETRPALGTERWWAALDAEITARGGSAPPLPVLARLLREHPGVFELALPPAVGVPLVRVLSLLPAKPAAAG